ncbi:MAG: hypothetical protein ACM3X1_04500 [Ignavibacteriales bacterium]
MDLYLIRHGQSGSGKNIGRGLSPNGTNKKTLTAEGVIEIELTGNALKTLNIIPQLSQVHLNMYVKALK